LVPFLNLPSACNLRFRKLPPLGRYAMNCPKCHALIPDHSAICPKCGTVLELISHTGHPRPHVHPEMHIAPLSEEKRIGPKILGGLLAVRVIAGAVWGFLHWKASRVPAVAAWPSPPRPVAGLPTGGIELGQLADTIGAPAGVPCAVCTQGQFTQLDAGANHTCARRTDGSVLCWGANLFGQLGVRTATECVTVRGRIPCALLPVQVPIERVASVSAGSDHTCALGADSTLTCWGSGYRGQLGVRQMPRGTLLVRPQGNLKYIAASSGQYHTCAIRPDGTVQCWGLNVSGQVGATTTEQCGPTMATRLPCASRPMNVETTQRFKAVAAGGDHTCGIATDGRAWCWGINRVGQLGTGGTGEMSVPVAVVSDQRFEEITAGMDFTCARTAEGAVWCWGSNMAGQIGVRDSVDHATPVQVMLPAPARSIGSGTAHACAVVEGARIFCWGAGMDGQLGTGRRADSRVPIEAGIDQGNAPERRR
jgi:alpha-tubulin suppressor-like RCC1 family protein